MPGTVFVHSVAAADRMIDGVIDRDGRNSPFFWGSLCQHCHHKSLCIMFLGEKKNLEPILV